MPFRNPQEMGRPVTIKDEGLSLHTNVSEIDFVGAGVSGSAVGAAITENIPGGGGSYTPETPSGTVNGSNKVFTITSANLMALFLGGVYQRPGGVDYTLSSTTITFVTAPRLTRGGSAPVMTAIIYA